ncbi:stalk domain-containing protein [Fusibacter ferrireducens]|uniref:Copper amine oxidase-like N-terminal domain-containing protein n=1 Tax=Fusibacter ferrireducens TaxID=2785058 RepID=A0ABR9ZQX9_9FIRM|nr:stalk domain-containing protein [Fusibacter ferrireducens]MBF4692044.1 hypothetical protein [Fusibacter ferrireducens]
MKKNKFLLTLLVLMLVFNMSFAEPRPDAKDFPTRSIIIGAYVIDYSALDPKTIALAQETVESSGQKKIYYKSDLTSQKIWVDITNGESISDISDKSSNIISDTVINALPLTHWIKVDGSVVIFETGEVKSINDMHTLLDPRANELLQKLTINYDLAKNLFDADDEDAVSEMTKNILGPVLLPLSQATIEGYDKLLASWDDLSDYLTANGGSDTAIGLVSAEKESTFTNREIAVNNALLGRLNSAADSAVKNGLNALNADIWESIGKVESKITELQDTLNTDKSSPLAIYRATQEQKLQQAIINKDFKTAEDALETMIHADHISAGLILDKPSELKILTITFGESVKSVQAIASEGKGAPYYNALKNGEPAATLNTLADAQASKLKEALSELQLIVTDIIARLDQPEAQQELLSQAIEAISKALEAVPKESDAIKSAAAEASNTGTGTASGATATGTDVDQGNESGDGSDQDASGTSATGGTAGDVSSDASNDASAGTSDDTSSNGSGDVTTNGSGDASANGTNDTSKDTSGSTATTTGAGSDRAETDGTDSTESGTTDSTKTGDTISGTDTADAGVDVNTDEASLVSAQSPSDLLSSLKADLGDQLNANKALNDPETQEQLEYLETLNAKNDNLYKTYLGALENNDTALADEIKDNMAVLANQQDALYGSFASLYQEALENIATLEAEISDNEKRMDKTAEADLSTLSSKNKDLEAQIDELREALAKYTLLLDPTDKQLLDMYADALAETKDSIATGDPITMDDDLEHLLTLFAILPDTLKSDMDINALTSLIIKASKEAYLANLEDQGDAILALTAKLTPDQMAARLALANDTTAGANTAGTNTGADVTASVGTADDATGSVASGDKDTGAETDVTATTGTEATGTKGGAGETGTISGTDPVTVANAPSMMITRSDSGQYILVRVPTREIQGITYVPIKTFYNLFDIEVLWHPETVSVEVKGLMQTEIFIENSMIVQKDDSPAVMDYPMKIIEGVSYAPIGYYTTDTANFIMPNISKLTLIIIPIH